MKHTTEKKHLGINNAIIVSIIIALLIYSILSINTFLSVRFTLITGIIIGFFIFPRKKLIFDILLSGVALVLLVLLIFIPLYIKGLNNLTFLPFLIFPSMLILSIAVAYAIKKSRLPITYSTAFILSVLLFLLITSSRKFGEGWFFVTTIISFVYSAFLLREIVKKDFFVVWTIVCLPFVLPFFIFSGQTGLYLVLPGIIVSMIFGYIVLRRKNNIKFNVLSYTITAIVLLTSWVLQENWASWVYSTQYNKMPGNAIHFSLINKEKEIVHIDTSSINVYLFWASYCSNCKKEFPYFEKLANDYKKRSDINFYTVYLQTEINDTVTFNHYAKINTQVTWTIAENSKEIQTNLLTDGVPFITIIGFENKILYNGCVNNRPWIFVKRPSNYFPKAIL